MGKVSSLTLRPESSHRSNINGSRNTRGNDAILHEYYYIKVSNTIEKKKEKTKREKKNEKKMENQLPTKLSRLPFSQLCYRNERSTKRNRDPYSRVIIIAVMAKKIVDIKLTVA